MSLLRWHRRAIARLSSKLWADGKGLERSVHAVLLLSVALLPAMACMSRAPPVPPDPPPAPSSIERGEALASNREPVGTGPDVLLPLKPEKWQKTKDCDPDMDEHLLNGACYARMSRKPPCGPKLRRHGDACYRFVAAPEQPRPSSGW